MKKEIYNTIKEKVDKLELLVNGGKGSGNFGHSGRPGEIGGSGSGKENPDILKIVDVLKKDKSYDLHDMSPEMVVELMGEETIHKDNLEDLQHYIDRAASEMSALEAEADEEFGPIPKKEKSDGLKEIADEHRVKVEKLSSKGNLSADEQQELRVEQRRYAQVQMERLVKAPYHEGKGYVELDGKHFTLGEREMADAVLAYPQYIDLPMFTALREKLIKNEVDTVYNGGKGSGNFGHSGRPGEIGGSGKGNYHKDLLDTAKADMMYATEKYEKAIEDGDQSAIEEADAERVRTEEFYDKLKREMEEKGQSKPKEKKSGEISLKGKSLYEKVHMIEPGDEVHITPKDNLPNFDRKIKVDYIQDGTIHYGSSETSDGYTYPAWAIKDITKIVRKKKNSIYAEVSKRLDEIEKMINGGKGSGNFGHAGRPGEVGGSSSGGVNLDKAKEVVKKMGEELRKKSPVRKQDEWFVTLKQIDDEYEKRGSEMEDNAGEVESAIYETGETWSGPKEKAMDLVKIGIRTNRDMFDDQAEFLEQTEGLFDDLKYLEDTKTKDVAVYEHPMSPSGIAIEKRPKNTKKSPADVEKAERQKHIKEIDKILEGTQLVPGSMPSGSRTKAEDTKNLRKLERDLKKIKAILKQEKSRENFGQEEVRKIEDKYSDYRYDTRFRDKIRDFEDWADYYQNW